MPPIDWDLITDHSLLANGEYASGAPEADLTSEMCKALLDLKLTVGPLPQDILDQYDALETRIDAKVETIEQGLETLSERVESLTEGLQGQITALAERVEALENP
jgi:polyhydroxyalkanoate synthesis regulator phasin